ncbi:MAG: hypothetical protein H0V25_11780 [Solirubrobacterales bacterium]|nr:hypothetical protein [Solirubrobacterales bacterium]
MAFDVNPFLIGETSGDSLIVLASADSLIVLAVLVILVFAVAYGLFTRQGSGINKHPGPDAQDTVVGDETKKENSDLQEDERAGVDRTESGELDQRGTK